MSFAASAAAPNAVSLTLFSANVASVMNTLTAEDSQQTLTDPSHQERALGPFPLTSAYCRPQTNRVRSTPQLSTLQQCVLFKKLSLCPYSSNLQTLPQAESTSTVSFGRGQDAVCGDGRQL